MRDYSSHDFDPQVFLNQVQRISNTESIKQWKLCTTEVIERDNISLERKFEFDFHLPEYYLDNVMLAISSWYLGDLGWVLRESIKQKYSSEQSRRKETVILDLCLESKTVTELFLLDTTLWNTNEFFGRYSEKRLNFLLTKIVKWKMKPKAKKVQRKRSSDDKSTASHSIVAGFYDKRFGDFTSEHYEIENQKEITSNTMALLFGYLGADG